MIRCLSRAVALVVLSASTARPQQKGQWLLGSFGLNAGEFPVPGFSYSNTTSYYTASRLNDASGAAIAAVSGRYSYWLNSNQLQYVPKTKVLGGYFTPYIDLDVSRGSVVVDISGTDLSSASGGSGFADTFVAPIAFGWHLKDSDLSAAYGFTAPTGRFSPGASNNVGSGYWGNNLLVGVTAYLTKNQATTANLFVDWEGHGETKGTEIIPGQAVSLEWGVGRDIPLDKQKHRLIQGGLVGYDQWQVSRNSGVTSRLPAYAVHAIGGQTNFVLDAINASFFLKYYDEVSARARTQGRTLVFGGSWTRAAK